MGVARPVIASLSVVLALATAGHAVQLATARTAPGVIAAATSADLQAALDAAQPGQTIVLEAGRTYEGPFHLPNKTGDGWITIRTNHPDFDRLLPPGRRAKPADARLMPRLVSATDSVLHADAGAHHYKFIGLEVAPAPGVFLYQVIDLSTDTAQTAAIPHDFTFERMYVHGDPARGSRRGFALNSASTSISDSYISDFKEAGQDSQAICGWNGPGPFTIVNNYLEGAGENLMFGGGDPTIPDLVPSDIVIRRNHFAKPVWWRPAENPAPGTPHWTVKNLLELKNARRVTIDGNTLEYNWLDAQVGYAILFTPRNQDGGSPWSVVEDVTFTNNVVRHVAAAMSILGWDDIHDSRQTTRVRVANNLFVDVGGSWGFGRLFQIANGTADLTIDHNTALQTETPVFGGDTLPHTNFVFTNNIVPHNEYGFIGTNLGTGRVSIEHYFPGATIARNAIVGGDPSKYPADNFFPASMRELQFAAAEKGNYRLLPSSPLHGKATDGGDVGADLDAIARAIGNIAVPRSPADAAGVAGAIFWISAALVLYTYLGYPAVLWLLARRRARRAPIAPALGPLPPVTVLVIAYNEAARIARRIDNLRASDYPAGRLSIVIASDGSTDDTVEIAHATHAARVIAFPSRRGKAAVLNDVLPRLHTDLVVLADARQPFAPDALRRLVAPLEDTRVGAVSGLLVLQREDQAEAGSVGSGLYWRYEVQVRQWESDVDSTIGSTGAITAVRRALVEPLPPDTLVDDLLIPLRIARRGYRVVFAPEARAFDRLPATSRGEFARKVRTLAGNFQVFTRERWLLVPGRNRLWWQTVSHKGLRLLLPVFFAAAALANLALLASPWYRALLVAQLAFYGVAAAGGASRGLRKARWVLLPYTVCFLAWATIVAFVRFLRGRQAATWERAPVADAAAPLDAAGPLEPSVR